MAEIAVDALTKELLNWVAERPRTYGEAINTWKTSCPRFPVWEDAQTAGLVDVVSNDRALDESLVILTKLGKAAMSRLA